MGSGEDEHGLIFYAAEIGGLHLHEQGFRHFTKQPTNACFAEMVSDLQLLMPRHLHHIF